MNKKTFNKYFPTRTLRIINFVFFVFVLPILYVFLGVPGGAWYIILGILGGMTANRVDAKLLKRHLTNFHNV